MPKGGGRHKGAGKRDPRHAGLGTPPAAVVTLTLPAGRTVTVAYEDRSVVVAREDRGVLVQRND